jgi:16S rRNA (guanine527-N7)-methyltransferase
MKLAAQQARAGREGQTADSPGMQPAMADILGQGLEAMGLAARVDDKARARLLTYVQELKKWNRKMNLVARQTGDLQIVENHFLDSLTLLPHLQAIAGDDKEPRRSTLLDIGTGAGFPGLVLKAAWPDLEVTLVEPKEKRVSFLKHIIRTLKLDAVEVVTGRIDSDRHYPAQLQLGGYDLVTSRALTDIAAFLEMAAPFRSPAGRVICMKGPQGLEEAKIFQEEDGRRDLILLEIREWRLPFSGARRYLLCFGVQ